MARRWGLGPVFAFECRLGARRWQVYAARVVLVLAVLAGLTLIWVPSSQLVVHPRQLANLGIAAFVTIVTIQMAAVLLVAPALAAGALCVDKTRGTLLHALVTDLRDGEIVAGKLAGKLAPVFTLMLCSLPVLALCSLLGGFDAASVAGAYLATAGVAAVASALALLLSLWARRIHQALIPTYAALALWVGLYPAVMVVVYGWIGVGTAGAEQFVLLANPFGIVLAPFLPGPTAGLWEQAAFFLVAIVFALALVAITASRLRPVAVGQASRPARRGRPGMAARVMALLPGPPLDGNPVLWREWHRKRPSRWTGRFWVAYATALGLASAAAIAAYFLNPGAHTRDLAGQVNAWGVAVGLLLLSVSAATTLAEERDRGSLDVVLATPLSTGAVVWGKWLGTFAMVPRLAIFPVWVASGLALVSGRVDGVAWMLALILAYSAAITSLGLAAATRFSRPGRALVSSVMGYALLAVGLPVAVESVSVLSASQWSLHQLEPRLLLGTPYFGVLTATDYTGSLGSYDYSWRDHSSEFLAGEPGWPGFWLAAYVTASAVVLVATIANFDRRLGRIPDRPRVRPVPPRAAALPGPVPRV